MKATNCIIIACLLVLLSACAPQSQPPVSATSRPADRSGISRLDIVDSQGNRYGMIQMTALGNAVIYNNEGEIIGNVTAATQEVAFAH